MICYVSMPEEHVRTPFKLIPKTGIYKKMTKPQSHENAKVVIIGSRNKPILM